MLSEDDDIMKEYIEDSKNASEQDEVIGMYDKELNDEMLKRAEIRENREQAYNEGLEEGTLEKARETVNLMTSLPDEDIEEIQKRINELEKIVNSKESKSKKWSKAKDIIKWVADKGVDVGIALLPLVLKIS